jgi:hypothetical protein
MIFSDWRVPVSFRIIKDEDKGFEAFFDGLRDMAKLRVKVGIQGGEANEAHGDDGITMLQLGTIHEFGAPSANIPQRSFLRSTADVNKKKYFGKLNGLVKKLVRNPVSTKVKGELFKLGERVRKDTINRIRKAEINQNLAASTKRAKARKSGGKVEPALIDQGLLIGSISSEVKAI